MQISERLKTVACAVKSGGTVADVGCDHAFTSIYMIENGIADHVIATDIGRLPLMRAKEHVTEFGLTDMIETRLSDGLVEIGPDEVDTVLISGMGGALMARILDDGQAVIGGISELVLSPQSEIFLVRSFLNEHCFVIDREYMIFEQGKYYVVIHAVPGNEPKLGRAEQLYGRRLIQEKNPVLKSFLEIELCRIEGVLNKLKADGMSYVAEVRRQQLYDEREMVEQVLGLF